MSYYRFLADVVLLAHFAYALFICIGMAAILAGIAFGWRWVRNFWFRLVHFLMIALVAAESLCGIVCPLTNWEDRLRELAGEPNGPGTFIGRWVEVLLFVNIHPSVLAVCYCLFSLSVLALLILAPPQWPKMGIFARMQRPEHGRRD